MEKKIKKIFALILIGFQLRYVSTCFQLPELCILESTWNTSTKPDVIFDLQDIICNWQSYPQKQIQAESAVKNQEKLRDENITVLTKSHNWFPKCPIHILVNVRDPSIFEPLLEILYQQNDQDSWILFANLCEDKIVPMLLEESLTFAQGFENRILFACRKSGAIALNWSKLCINCPEQTESFDPTSFKTVSLQRNSNKTLILKLPHGLAAHVTKHCQISNHAKILSLMPNCSGIADSIQILSSELGATYQFSNEGTDELDLRDLYLNTWRRSRVLPPDELQSVTFSHAKMIFGEPGTQRPFYCIEAPSFFPPNWTTLLQCFDTNLWIGILLSILSLAAYVIFLLYGTVPTYILPLAVIDVFLSILNGSTCLSKRIKAATLVSLLFIVLVTLYLGMITSDFILIPSRPGLHTLLEAFNAGYRYIVPESAIWSYYYVGIPIFEKIVQRESPSFKMNTGHFVGASDENLRTSFSEMVSNKAFGAAPIFTKVQFPANQFNYGGFKCFFFQEDQKIEVDMVTILRHKRAEDGKQIFQGMDQGGFIELWSVREGWRQFQKHGGKENLHFGPQSYKALPLRCHIQIVFFQLLIALGGSGGVLLVEICWKAVSNWWRALQIRQRHNSFFSQVVNLAVKILYEFGRNVYNSLRDVCYIVCRFKEIYNLYVTRCVRKHGRKIFIKSNVEVFQKCNK